MNKLACLSAFLLLLLQVSSTVVTLDNLEGFFGATYDKDNDGFATM